MGITLDVGRMYVVKNEAQAYADAGALLAARQLDGSAQGVLTRAGLLALNPNRYDFGNKEFEAAEVTVEYGKSMDGPWLAPELARDSPAGMNFVRMSANPSTVLYFLPIVVPRKAVVVPGLAVAARGPRVRLVQ